MTTFAMKQPDKPTQNKKTARANHLHRLLTLTWISSGAIISTAGVACVAATAFHTNTTFGNIGHYLLTLGVILAFAAIFVPYKQVNETAKRLLSHLGYIVRDEADETKAFLKYLENLERLAGARP
jgi:hypothetical protein